jgi:hypothetical protein
VPDILNTAEPQKPRRHWFQFSLRKLAMLTVLVAVLAWAGLRINVAVFDPKVSVPNDRIGDGGHERLTREMRGLPPLPDDR